MSVSLKRLSSMPQKPQHGWDVKGRDRVTDTPLSSAADEGSCLEVRAVVSEEERINSTRFSTRRVWFKELL